MFAKTIGLLALVNVAIAICPGFNYAIGNMQYVGNDPQFPEWFVYDDSCNVVDGLVTNLNPCDQGIFGCSPPPIIFNQYTSTHTGLIYSCRPDPNSGICDGDIISVCCRNDGH